MIELALPAGSLETALTAFKNGADAVYFGLKDFSARKGAINFSIEDLSKIRRYSLENNKKIYLTINTLIDDKNIEKVLSTLDEVSFYGNDGIIIQDLGVSRIIRNYFPSLKLHGSTQLAIHTTDGVKVLQDMGFERVVLSRELSLKEIEKIRISCPDVQLKTFIHGALCYGFSGLCSASYNKCSRSANGGECAQICRSWFAEENSNRKGYFFSMQDMLAGEYLLKLNDIGIDSAKIEGRLKSPEYVASTARYYRDILDKRYVDENKEQDVSTTFARKHGLGYLNYSANRASLLSGDYPAHMGLLCGPIIKHKANIITVQTTVAINSHDGLQYFTKDNLGLLVSNKFSAQVVFDQGSYRKDIVKLKISSKEDLTGKILYKISDSTKKEKTPSTNIALYKKPIDISISLSDDSLSARALGIDHKISLSLQEAKNPLSCFDVLSRHFKESSDSLYTLKDLYFENNSSFISPFLPPSLIKEFRRVFYQKLDNLNLGKTVVDDVEKIVKKTIILPNRNLLKDDLPWSFKEKIIDNHSYFTFPPVTFNEEKMLEKALSIFRKAKDENKIVTIGLNNISQIRFAKNHPEFDYFIDVFLYLSNRYTALELLEELPTLVGGYLWFERKESSFSWPFEYTVVKDFEMPSFISRTCYRHDSRGESCSTCKKKEDYFISQGSDRYSVKVRDCLTVVEHIM